MENDSNNARTLRKARGGQTSLRAQILKRIHLTDNYIYMYMMWVIRERFCNAEYIITGKLSLGGSKYRIHEPTTKRNAPGCGIRIKMRSGATISEISLWQPWLHFCYFLLMIYDVYIYRVGPFRFWSFTFSRGLISVILADKRDAKAYYFWRSDRCICTRQRNKRRDWARSRIVLT